MKETVGTQHTERIEFTKPPANGDSVLHLIFRDWNLPIMAYIWPSTSSLPFSIEIMQKVPSSITWKARSMSLELLLNQSMKALDDEYPYSMQIGFDTEFGMALSESVTIHRGRIHAPIADNLFSENQSVILRSLGSLNSDARSMIEFAFTFNGNMVTLKWILSLIASDGQLVSPPIVHALRPEKIWMTSHGGKVVSFSMEILDDILESMTYKKVPYYVESQRAYNFRIGFVDGSITGNAPVLGPEIMMSSDSISSPMADTYRQVPLDRYRLYRSIRPQPITT